MQSNNPEYRPGDNLAKALFRPLIDRARNLLHWEKGPLSPSDTVRQAFLSLNSVQPSNQHSRATYLHDFDLREHAPGTVFRLREKCSAITYHSWYAIGQSDESGLAVFKAGINDVKVLLERPPYLCLGRGWELGKMRVVKPSFRIEEFHDALYPAFLDQPSPLQQGKRIPVTLLVPGEDGQVQAMNIFIGPPLGEKPAWMDELPPSDPADYTINHRQIDIFVAGKHIKRPGVLRRSVGLPELIPSPVPMHALYSKNAP